MGAVDGNVNARCQRGRRGRGRGGGGEGDVEAVGAVAGNMNAMYQRRQRDHWLMRGSFAQPGRLSAGGRRPGASPVTYPESRSSRFAIVPYGGRGFWVSGKPIRPARRVGDESRELCGCTARQGGVRTRRTDSGQTGRGAEAAACRQALIADNVNQRGAVKGGGRMADRWHSGASRSSGAWTCEPRTESSAGMPPQDGEGGTRSRCQRRCRGNCQNRGGSGSREAWDVNNLGDRGRARGLAKLEEEEEIRTERARGWTCHCLHAS